jgi:hypothetical protein
VVFILDHYVAVAKEFTMRLASLAVIGLIMTSTPAYAGTSSSERAAKAACVTSLAKAKGSSGFEVVQKCAKGAPAKLAASSAAAQPMGGERDAAASEGGLSGTSVVVGLLGLTAFVFGVLEAVDSPSSP